MAVSELACYSESMARPEYREMLVKSALNKVQGMPFKWSLNPYRGCVHSCHYCYARATHTFLDLDVAQDFTGIIFAKTNLPEVLAAELGKRNWHRESVAFGTATDPYQPAEGRFRITRRCLEVMARYRTPTSLVTKGTLAVRDIDALQELGSRAGATVCFSVPSVDTDVWRRVEPGTAPPRQRLRAMERLVGAGVNAGVLMAPLLPDISATPERIRATVQAAADHGAQFIGVRVLYLEPSVRDYFMEFVGRDYPDLWENYQRLYPEGRKYGSKPLAGLIEERVRDAKSELGFADGPHYRPVQEAETTRQLTLL